VFDTSRVLLYDVVYEACALELAMVR